MKKAIVLLAGYPGTGKSYLCDKIMKKESDFNIVSLDEIKEAMFDEVGCNNLEEKEMVINQSWEEYYHVMEDNMIKGLRIISDYPFSEKQKNRIDTLAKKYDYERITIRLVADIDVLYERQRKRDLDPNRHLSHIVSHYHKGDKLDDRSKADCLIDYKEFKNRCNNRGYGEFQLGHLIEVDVTDFSKVNFEQTLITLHELLK